MRVFVAEKHSQGEAIAAGLGNPAPARGHIRCGSDIVTWCAGHLFEEFMPEDYDIALARWTRDSLPIIPAQWRNKPKTTAAGQLAVIKELLRKADTVVNCGDPDREGQALVDEVLEHFGYQGPVLRLWLDDGLTPQAVRRALDRMRRNTEYAPLRDAARARSRADWLVGMNATRAMTLKGREAGQDGPLRIGRVKTPTLNLVVMRDLEIEHFQPHPFYVLKALFAHGDDSLWATFKPAADMEGLDSEGRLVDKARADTICTAVTNAQGEVVFSAIEEKKRLPPLAYSLSALSQAASSRYGLSAKQVLDAAQALYLARLTSYPRTNCRYLPDDQHAEGRDILAALARLDGSLAHVATIAAKADASLKSPAWNSARQTAHHGIIPTGELPAAELPPTQRQIYELVCENYALQFHPAMRYEAREVHISVADTLWKASGQRVLETGWTAFEGSKNDDGEIVVPAIAKGETVICAEGKTEARKTTPPARFTDGTLLEAMENVHRFVEADANTKEMLKKNKGIGTDATRAAILDELLKSGLLRMDGKKIVSTPLGRQLIELVPGPLKDPLTTADWESRLEDVAEGKVSLNDFLQGVADALPRYLEAIASLTIKTMPGTTPCPECGQPLRRFHSKEGSGFYWACHNKNKHKTGKSLFLDDKDGKPLVRIAFPCPVCRTPLKRFRGKDGAWRWGCFNEQGHPSAKPLFLDDANGKPVLHLCPECKQPLRRQASKKKPGEFYWACFNESGHKSGKAVFARDDNNKPVWGGMKK